MMKESLKRGSKKRDKSVQKGTTKEYEESQTIKTTKEDNNTNNKHAREL